MIEYLNDSALDFRTKEHIKTLSDDEFKEAFARLAATNEGHAFQLIAGMFVGFLEYLAIENGCDKKSEIKVEGNGGRDITVHAIKKDNSLLE